MVLSFAAAPVHAHAQGVPTGSYLRTCTHVATYGDRLIADCRRTDGSWGRTALRDVGRCTGDTATWAASLPAMVTSVTMAGGIATTANHQGTAIAMTATADLLRFFARGLATGEALAPSRRSLGLWPITSRNGVGGHSSVRWDRPAAPEL